MRSISQRELRNDSGEIMRQVRNGASFHVTSRGEPVALLSPLRRTILDEMTLREGSQDMDFPPGKKMSESSEQLLAELRGDR